MQERDLVLREAQARNLRSKPNIGGDEFSIHRKRGCQIDAIVNRLGKIKRYHECLAQYRERWKNRYS